MLWVHCWGLTREGCWLAGLREIVRAFGCVCIGVREAQTCPSKTNPPANQRQWSGQPARASPVQLPEPQASLCVQVLRIHIARSRPQTSSVWDNEINNVLKCCFGAHRGQGREGMWNVCSMMLVRQSKPPPNTERKRNILQTSGESTHKQWGRSTQSQNTRNGNRKGNAMLVKHLVEAR